MYADKPQLHVRQRTHKRGELRTIALDTTSRCNMSCSHCYAQTFSSVEMVDPAILKMALDEAYSMGVFHYVFQGGEPIVDPDRLEIILKNCHPDATYINIVSNGWGMTRDRIKWLRDLKVDKISYSLDSGIADEHNLNRIAGSYDKVMEAIENTLKCGLLTGISTVTTHQFLYSEGFNAAYRFAVEKQIRMDVQIAMPVGKWDGRKDLLVTDEDTKYLWELYQHSPILPNGQKLLNRDIFCGFCPAVTEFISITASGEVLPCNFIQYTMGNIKEKSLTEMRNDFLALEWFDGRHLKCLCGEDMDFVDKFIVPYVDRQKPLNAYEIFGL
ncbi:MAG: radical SAM/SPASM domain-containing protein [Acidobacteriota bacterium]